MDTDSSADGTDLQAILDALDDPDCRAILRKVDDAMTAQQLMETLDLSQTTAYRKLEKLDRAGLVAEETEIRADGHHTSRYRRAVAGVTVVLTGEAPFAVRMIPESATGPDRLARFWAEMGEEL